MLFLQRRHYVRKKNKERFCKNKFKKKLNEDANLKAKRIKIHYKKIKKPSEFK